MTVKIEEISFTSLYLIIKRGLPFIATIALSAGTISYFLVARQSQLFQASSTVIIAPPSAEFIGDGTLRFQPIVYTTFDLYKDLAYSEKVVEKTLNAHPETNLTPNEFIETSSIKRATYIINKGVEKGLPLVVDHQLLHTNPSTAADLTNIWVEETMIEVRKSLLVPLAPTTTPIETQLRNVSETLKAIEMEWQTFSALNNLELLESSLVNFNHQIVEGTDRLMELDSLTRIVEREKLVLQSELLDDNGLEKQMIDIEESLTESQSEEPTLIETLRAQTLRLELLRAEKGSLQEQLIELGDKTSELLTKRSELAQMRDEILNKLRLHRTTYANLSNTSTTIHAVRDLILSSAKTLSLATPPSKPQKGDNPWKAAVIAMVISGMVSTLPFFVREALKPQLSIKDRPPK